jgi:hypothetical protein
MSYYLLLQSFKKVDLLLALDGKEAFVAWGKGLCWT